MEEIEIVITELIWDDWNVDHVARHNITIVEVEQPLRDKDAVFLKAKQGRVMVLGRAGARLITVVLNAQETDGEYYVITARDMSKKERAFYRAQKEIRHG
ncbi:MAG: BrnT family toxin [Anaerolineae bacterium]|nr:BrnT family toxin [Anaerolineae bacterium]